MQSERKLSKEQEEHERDKLRHFQRLGRAAVVNNGSQLLSSDQASSAPTFGSPSPAMLQATTPVNSPPPSMGRQLLSSTSGRGRGMRGTRATPGAKRSAVTMSADPNDQRDSFAGSAGVDLTQVMHDEASK